jgi:hypothetical protein
MHKSHKILIDELVKANKKVKVGEFYYHYKKPELSYKVIKLAVMEADDSICVIYEAQYRDNIVFVRPLKSWLEKVEWNNKKVDRFTEILTKQE